MWLVCGAYFPNPISSARSPARQTSFFLHASNLDLKSPRSSDRAGRPNLSQDEWILSDHLASHLPSTTRSRLPDPSNVETSSIKSRSTSVNILALMPPFLSASSFMEAVVAVFQPSVQDCGIELLTWHSRQAHNCFSSRQRDHCRRWSPNTLGQRSHLHNIHPRLLRTVS